MDKVYGTTVRQDGLRKVGRRCFILFYGLYTDESGSTYEYRQTFDHKPTWDEVRRVILDTIDCETRQKILNGFIYNGKRVWLSDENQRNYDIIERKGTVYPMKIKLNEAADGTAVYHIFESAEEFATFNNAASAYIIDTWQAGRKEKESLDPSAFGFER